MSERLVDESPPGTPLLLGLPLGGVVGGGTSTRSNSAGGDSWNVSGLWERAAREVWGRTDPGKLNGERNSYPNTNFWVETLTKRQRVAHCDVLSLNNS
jgi:hypothetical protein